MKLAFRGELVPTEAEVARQEGREYEAAGALLVRIKREPESSRTTSVKRLGRARQVNEPGARAEPVGRLV